MAEGGAEAVDDISAIIPFYDNERRPGPSPEVGQIVFAPVLATDSRPNCADAVRSDPQGHRSADLIIRPLDASVDFRGKSARLPIKALYLGENEELIVSRAKKRPCLILAKSDGVNANTIPKGRQRDKALNAFHGTYCLAPIYSVSTAEKARSFGPVMTARAKCLMYPEFVYVPQSGMIIKAPGVLRLDRLFWSHLAACCDSENLFVSKEILGICSQQMQILAGESPANEYGELRAMMLAFLPENCKAIS